MITAIVRRQKPIRMLRIADHPVKINHRIEVSRCTDPAIHRLPVSFAHGTRVIVARTDVWRDRCTVDTQPVSVRTRNHLLICSKHPCNERRVLCRRHLSVTR